MDWIQYLSVETLFHMSLAGGQASFRTLKSQTAIYCLETYNHPKNHPKAPGGLRFSGFGFYKTSDHKTYLHLTRLCSLECLANPS